MEKTESSDKPGYVDQGIYSSLRFQSDMGDVIIHPYISDGKPVIVAFAQTHIVELNISL